MKERPILFSAPMVRAILGGRKSQTRRIINKPEWYGCPTGDCPHGAQQQCDEAMNDPSVLSECPYGGPGDRLWVRETHITGWPAECGEIQQYDDDGNELPRHCWYKATPESDGSFISLRGERIVSWLDTNERTCDRIPWKPSIHMPRWACRITLEVVSVRVERLQEISEADAEAEGCDPALPVADKRWVCGYRRLWESINGPGSWAANPWVWVLEFQRVSAGGAA